MAETILSLEDAGLSLTGNAGPVDILHGVSLTISKGESVSLVGPSGSGKSSLLMLMGGLERPTSGTVRALDHDLGRMDEDALARFRRNHMGVVFQSFHLIPTMSALENVATPLELAGVTDAFKKARGALDTVGLTHRQDHFPGQLSGGEQQRLAIARAVVSRPSILIADEPTGNLDRKNTDIILNYLFKLKKNNRLIIIATHNRDLAKKTDLRLTLSNGNVINKS